MSDFAADYSRAVKFSRAPAEGIHDFFKQSVESGNQDPSSVSDAVFADWLEDHDDPRHHIIRGDLAIRQHPDNNWSYKQYAQLKSLLGTDEGRYGYWMEAAPEDSHSLEIQPIKSSKSNQWLYSTTWSPLGGHPGSYQSFLHRHQVDELIDKLGCRLIRRS